MTDSDFQGTERPACSHFPLRYRNVRDGYRNMWQHLMLNLKCIFCPCCTPEPEPRHLFTLHYGEIQTGLNDYKWPLCVLAPTCIRFRLRNLSKEITWDKMDISKLQACNSKGSVYRFSVSSNPAGEKIVWT